VPHLVSELALPASVTERAPLRFAVGVDGALALQLPAAPPSQILRASADGQTSTAGGLLLADAPLAFTAADGAVAAESLDGKVAYTAVERVTGPGPWTRTPASTGCCGFAESTLWRAAPGKLDGGLLRAVTPPAATWSVLDFHVPGSIEPRWRVSLTEGKRAVVAAAMAPSAEHVFVVVADAQGAAELQARASADGKVQWAAALDGAPAEWRSGAARLALSRDGARAAVLLESRQRCATCVAVQVLDARTGARGPRIEVEPTVAPRFCTLGLGDRAVWLFEHVPPKSTDLSSRPERCTYLSFDAATGAQRAAPASEWSFDKCTVAAMAQPPTGGGVVALAWSGAKVRWLSSDDIP
jgi:hypothetical protein